jgi:CHAD domain-containing protein
MVKAKEIAGLDCEADAARGIPLVLNARFAEMIEFREAALDANEIEGVHDMRVASRRVRSAVRDFLPYLSEANLSSAREELRGLGDALGRARNHDVASVALEEVRKEAPAGVSRFVKSMARERRAQAAKERAALAGEISAERLTHLRDEFVEALRRALAAARRRKRGDRRPQDLSLRAVGREIIFVRWRELRRRCANLYHPFKVKKIHRARISAKRLRYALELFALCFGDSLKDLAKEVTKLQKSLGELHDCDDLIASFGAHLAGYIEGSSEDASERAALVWLMDHFVEQRTKHFRDALARWHEWETSGFEARLRERLGE